MMIAKVNRDLGTFEVAVRSRSHECAGSKLESTDKDCQFHRIPEGSRVIHVIPGQFIVAQSRMTGIHATVVSHRSLRDMKEDASLLRTGKITI